jgi:hypothetical protein
MNWVIILQLLPVIMEVINGCNTDDDAVLVQRLKNPGPFAVLRLARAVGEERGIYGREWRQQRSSIIAEVRQAASSLTDDEARELIYQLRQGAA